MRHSGARRLGGEPLGRVEVFVRRLAPSERRRLQCLAEGTRSQRATGHAGATLKVERAARGARCPAADRARRRATAHHHSNGSGTGSTASDASAGPGARQRAGRQCTGRRRRRIGRRRVRRVLTLVDVNARCAAGTVCIGAEHLFD